LNFKKASFLFLIALLISSCGVKNDPTPPPGTEIPSWESEFLNPIVTPTPSESKDK